MDASLVFDIDSSQARGAAKALADLNKVVIQTANSSAKFEKTLRGSDGQFRSTIGYLAEHTAEVESLAKSYNPMLAAQIAYREESIRTGVAVKAGVIDEQRRAEILQRTKASLEATAAAAMRFGQSQEVARHHVANLSFQLNDIGMMMAMGQNPFMLMMQQGPQVAQIFSQMNQEGRKLGPTLAGAFKMFLNPTTAVTLALVGGAAALGQWAIAALGAERETLTLADATDRLSTRAADIKRYADISQKSILELSKEYGALAWQVRDAANALGELERAEVRKGLIDAVTAARKEYGQLGYDLDAIEAKMAALPDAMRYGRGSSGIAAELLLAERAVNKLAEAMNIPPQQAREFSKALAQLDAARTFEDQAAALRGVHEVMQRLNIDAALLPDEIRAALIEWQRLNLEAAQSEGIIRGAVGATDDWRGAMSSVLSYVNAIGQSLANIGGDGIRFAATRAEAKALQEGKSLREAGLVAARETARLEGEYRTAELQKQYGIWGKVLGMGEAAAKQALITEEANLDILREQAREREREEKKSGSKGDKSAERRAAAELRAAEKGFQSLRELLEKESLFQFAEYDKRQAQLETALQKNLVTEKEYQEYASALRIEYFGTDYQRRQLQYDMEHEQLKAALERELVTRQEYDALMRQRQWDQVNRLGEIKDTGIAYELNQMASGFSQAAALAGDYNDKFLRAQKIFAASAALISTYQGAAKALELPFPMNIAAAAKVVAAGLGFVSAIKGGGRGGGGAASSTSVQQAPKEPTRYVTINWDGPDWMRDGINGLLDEIYDQSKDGRVIIAQERR